MNKLALGITAGVLLLVHFFQPALAAEKPPSVESFFSDEGISAIAISPSGQHIAIARRQKGNVSIVAIIDSLDPGKLKVVDNESGDWSVSRLGWVNDNRIYYQVWDPDRANIIGVVNIDGSSQKRLSGFKRSGLTGSGYWGAMHDGSNNIVAQTVTFKNSDRSADSVHLYKIDTISNDVRDWDQTAQPKRVIAWLLDRADTPRIALSKIGSKCTSWYLAELPEIWVQLDQSECFTDQGFAPFFWESEQNLYVTHSDAGFKKLYAYDLKTHKIADHPLVDVKGFDFNGSIEYDHASERIVGVHYYTDAKGVVWFYPEMKAAQQIIDKKLPATINTIICGDCLSSPALLIRTASDKQPNRYYIYKKSDSSLVALGSNRPLIDPKQMGRRDFDRYKARDGMEIPAYVTQPPGPHQDHLPAVVLVHSEPWSRGGFWEWDSAAQFLASRGYLVIQPEFRGSTGFGYAHYHAGFRQWGLAMQDDLADAADWAIKKGWADPKRIAIVGGSYGGYAALMGLIKNPEVFRCGVAFSAPTDLIELLDSPINDISAEAKEVDMKVLIGDPDTDKAMLKANSPINHPEAIRNPLLMMHGAEDRRTSIGNASSLVSKIKESNKNVEWIVYADEGHGISHENNRIDFWTHVETFLDKYLKPVQ